MFTVKNARESDSRFGIMFAGLDTSCKMLGLELFFAVNVITFTESSDVFFNSSLNFLL